MPENQGPFKLSAQAFAEFKEIWIEQFGVASSDEEMYAAGTNLLRLFKLLLEPSSLARKVENRVPVTDKEFKALKYLHHAIYHDGKLPSVRDICAAVGLRSSRSGLLFVNKRAEREFVYRDSSKKLQLTERVRGCDVKFTNVAFDDKFCRLSQDQH